MPGLDPGIHFFPRDGGSPWMAGSSPAMTAMRGTDATRWKTTLIVVAAEPPFAQDLLHLLVVFHPLDGGGERRHQLDVALAERVAAVAVRVLVGARLVILDDVDLPLRMVLHLRGDHRLVVEHGVDAA